MFCTQHAAESGCPERGTLLRTRGVVPLFLYVLEHSPITPCLDSIHSMSGLGAASPHTFNRRGRNWSPSSPPHFHSPAQQRLPVRSGFQCFQVKSILYLSVNFPHTSQTQIDICAPAPHALHRNASTKVLCIRSPQGQSIAETS